MPGGLLGWLLLAVLCTAGVLVLQRVIVRVVSGEVSANRIRATGQPATAVVLDIHDTGHRVDAIFVLARLRLRVQPVDALTPFDVELDTPISPAKLAEFAPGRTVKVRVDRGTHEVAIDQERR